MNKKRTIDEIRYFERIKSVIRSKLPEIVSKSDIIESAPEDKVKIQIPLLDEAYFKPLLPGSGGAGGGKGAGSGGEGNHVVEIELTVEELAELLFEFLELPRLKPKGGEEVREEYRIEGIAKSGPKSRIHRRKTYLEILKKGLSEENIRYRLIRVREEKIFSAVIYFARDYSASMDDYKKFKVRSAAFWINQFIKLQYPKTITKFVVHDTEALFVNENEFFSLSEGGGTLCSSVFKLIKDDYLQYPLQDTNFYIFYFSDGENLENDNSVLAELVSELSNDFNLIVYGEIKHRNNYLDYFGGQSLINVFNMLRKENVIADRLISVKEFILKVFGKAVEQ